jgi:hypothetical protein
MKFIKRFELYLEHRVLYDREILIDFWMIKQNKNIKN